jgi:O-antigen ligase
MGYFIRQTRDKFNSGLFASIIILMAVSLNQSGIIFGVNLSAADFFCFLTLLILISTQKLLVSRVSLLYFTALTAHSLFVSFFYVPAAFNFFPTMTSILINYLKLAVSFFYYILGNCIVLLKQEETLIKYYSYAALFIGCLGIIAMLSGNKPLSSILVYEGVRLTGLMNDPNYFSLVQASALTYFCRVKDINGFLRFLICIIFLAAVLASGSKTGLITILVYALIQLVEVSLKNRLKVSFIIWLLPASIITVVAVYISAFSGNLIHDLTARLPALGRISVIFTDFGSAVSGMGSGRDLAWIVALKLIKLSPVMGIGLGTYSGLAEIFFGTDVIAHNTYLQLYSEWGIIYATILFAYIFCTAGKAVLQRRSERNISIAADMLVVFSIGSLAVSLNNARMFWIFLGILSADKMCAGDKEKLND